MKITRILSITIMLATSLLSMPSQAAIDADASVVKLRTSCQVAGNPLDNCFTDLNTLNAWIWQTRNPTPSSASPLRVDIGPGTFTGQFSCTSAGYVTLRGSGMGVTVIQNGSMPISTLHCDNMVFSHLTVKNTQTLFGVRNLGGSTFWDSVEIDGLGYAWFDSPGACNGGTPGSHHFFNSRIIAHTSGVSDTAVFNACDATWLIGSEITSIGASGAQVMPIEAVGGEVHVYGGNIRTLTDGNVSTAFMVAAKSVGNTEIHIHGTGIDVISQGPNDITALTASDGGLIHANASAYVLKTASGGSVTRIANSGGTVWAPYVWQPSANPPAITSANGADTAVITGTADGHPHMVIYDVSCASSWFDSTTGTCH